MELELAVYLPEEILEVGMEIVVSSHERALYAEFSLSLSFGGSSNASFLDVGLSSIAGTAGGIALGGPSALACLTGDLSLGFG